jgi:uncharacterized protein YfaS (alpha-2-macroglobulin family)
MMKRASLFTFVILSLFTFTWWIGYSGVLSGLHKTPNSTVQGQNVSIDRTTSSPKGIATPSLEQTKNTTNVSGLHYEGWRFDQSADQPKVCVEFDKALDTTQSLTLTDYVRVEPSVQLSTEVVDTSLCLIGFRYGNDYELTLLEGLPGADKQKLAADKIIDISFGKRPPFVAFAGNGVILPRIGAQGLGIETVNIDILEVEIFRVGDRIIARRNVSSGENTAEGDYSYEYQNVATNVRESIWKGEVKIESSLNELSTTVLPLRELIGDLKPGAYVVSAVRKHEDDNYTPARAWRWIISTDLAFTSYKSASGLDLGVRSIDSAEMVSGVRIDLVAQNNEILASTTTDKTGHVHFATSLLKGAGVMSPRMVMGYGQNGDYAVLDFNRSPLDLSAFDIGGRSVSGTVDSYIYTERGVYRPGETLHLTAMLRDKHARAISDRVGSIDYIKPNGVVFRTVRFDHVEAGTLLQAFDIPPSAPRGVWRAHLKIDGLGQVGQTDFSVEDFAPQQLRVALNVDDTPIRTSEVRPFEINAEFLYGATGSGLEAQAEARIRVDPKPFPKLADYYFGRADETFREIYMDLSGGTTDGSGVLELGLSLKNENIDTSHPLRVEITSGVSEPGGRYVQTSKRIPIRTNDIYIGIKPDFDNRAQRNKPAGFSVRAVNWKGEDVSLADAKWTLVEEDWHYNWYRQNERWKYKREIRDLPRSKGSFDIDLTKGASISQTLDWGYYRLIVTDAKTGAESSYRFSVGWGGANTSDAPDQIKLGVPSDPVQRGDMVTLTINAPYAGFGELVLADDEVRQIIPVNISEGGSEIKIKLDEDMGAGMYALLSVYTPRSKDIRPVPRRAVGIGYIPVDVSAQKLSVVLDAPDVVRPRRTQNINIKIDNAKRGEKIWLTLAAIDEGVLQITKYSSPDPQKHYFGKKRFAIDVRDDYARLLNPNLGTPLIAKSGGDSLGGEGLTATPIKVVSLYSGLVEIKNGKIKVPVELPDFNGELRLMATAWSESQVGSASQPMKVRDPVPASVALPRFLAPGDRALATISLDNLDGKSGSYQPRLIVDQALSVGGELPPVTLKQGERQIVRQEIIANQTGISNVDFALSGPGRYKINSQYQLETRSAFLPITRMKSSLMKEGTSFTLDPSIYEGLDAGSVDVSVSFTRTPGLDPTSYVAALSRYPYGCTEQTVSTALPLLYAGDLGGAPRLDQNLIRVRLQRAADRLVNRQGYDGAFGLWREGDGYANPWIGVYAADFLFRAREKEFNVTQNVLNKSTKALRTITKMERYPGLAYQWTYHSERAQDRNARHAEAAAYAHYVLARNAQGDLGAMRYFIDNHADKMRTPLGWAHLGAALAMMDDHRRADKAFDEAVTRLGYQNRRDYYQSSLRDSAGVLALAKEVSQDNVLAAVLTTFNSELKSPERLHTQEQAQTILAIRAFLSDAEPINIDENGTDMVASGGISRAHLLGSTLITETSTFTNKGNSDIWRSVTVTGTPLQAPLAQAIGYGVSKDIFTFTGQKADISQIKQGQKFIVRIRFNSDMKRPRQTVIADLLPAGMEIETILTPQEEKSNSAFAWLGKLSDFQTKEARDDRLVAALETQGKGTYAIAYVVRAVSQGDFIWPGVVVQDMYRPADQAFTAAERTIISAIDKG